MTSPTCGVYLGIDGRWMQIGGLGSILESKGLARTEAFSFPRYFNDSKLQLGFYGFFGFFVFGPIQWLGLLVRLRRMICSCRSLQDGHLNM